ncbi:trehalase-like [Belonocnema kinseyi]|uniref:trehalase-like n=1 Tax=Belonocnema kinseyi TaxID=2817044 RepID=UPI00143DE3F8|nr:trehalase-like [Belonocnema kinseyi]
MTTIHGLSLAFVQTSAVFKENRAFLLLCISPLLFTVASAVSLGHSELKVKDKCDSEIYCTGKLLKTVQLSNMFKDSKTFVDLVQLNDPEITLQKFGEFMQKTNNMPTEQEIKDFVNSTFVQEDEFEEWIPSDYVENPSILSRIQDPQFKDFAKQLNAIWKTLARKIKSEVLDHPTRHSLIPVDNGIVFPGGRFQEYYYWDSYWIIKGLLLCDMKLTARGMIENFIQFVDQYGFMANGGRVYYTMRSQPPLLTYMVQTYIDATKDYDFVKKILHVLDREFDFWEKKRTVDVDYRGKSYKMARYFVESDGPRPESYREDYDLAKYLPTDEAKREMYENIKTGAETGWDFSSRWLISPTENGQDPRRNLSNIATKYIIPVDLNAFLERNAKRLSKFHVRVGNIQNQDRYFSVVFRVSQAMPETPIKTIRCPSPSGIPTSLAETGEQWDLPNSWSPLQSIVINGLRETGYKAAVSLAEEFATIWLRSNYEGFKKYNEMFEKYDSVIPGAHGGGGEYVVQSGFGWTNGVVFELLDIYCFATSNDNIVISNIECKHLPA